MDKELIRSLPQVDAVLRNEYLTELDDRIPHAILLSAARKAIDSARQRILSGELTDAAEISVEGIAKAAADIAEEASMPGLRRVINATGVTLHTNMGRARLSKSACKAVIEAASNYSDLEYDIEAGQRGSRHSHIEKTITDITGAEAAMAVNNNAAAVMLCLSALGRGREIIISRGELVEIGGSFRIPDIMEQSGAILAEVGTTNKTHLADYENRLTEETAALLKVHTSNYKIVGFTEDVSLEDLASLGAKAGLPVIFDLGSGLMTDLRGIGIDEPTVKDSLKYADVIMFSGDKLLGGPQCGIIAGKKQYVDMMKKHPMARAFRVDKMTIAALEATLREYYDMEKALENLPVLASVAAPREKLRTKANHLAKGLEKASPSIRAKVSKCIDQVGGGSAPTAELSGFAVAFYSDKVSADELEKAFRLGKVPVVGRINKDNLIFDVRTVTDAEIKLIIEKAERLGAEGRI